ncbi:MAG: RNA methyltransferase, partial [Candidatus Micrarchaeia archaeon]
KIGDEAVRYAKHAADVLRKAKIMKKLAVATNGCSLIVGTTAIEKLGRDITRESITPEEFAKSLGRSKARIALLMGREGTGLSKDELRECDVVVRIITNPIYRTLNISHALAILLYELSKYKLKPTTEFMEWNEKRLLIKHFNSFVDRNKQGLRSPEFIKLAFKRILGRGIRSQVEA